MFHHVNVSAGKLIDIFEKRNLNLQNRFSVIYLIDLKLQILSAAELLMKSM
jgi:hypothetical protein